MSMITELIERLRESADDTELDMECSRACDGECNKLLREAADVIEELSTKLQSANMERSSQYYNGGWVPCSERLPDIDEEVLVADGLDIFVAWWVNGGYEARWHSLDESYKSDRTILAWMPLPKSYKTESEDKE